MEQKTEERLHVSQYLLRFYLFLRDRDARIIELFFLGLNTYILALVILPPNTYDGTGLLIRAAFQLFIVIANMIALIYSTRIIRILSALLNTMIMAFISFALVRSESTHAGTYILLAFLALFACWKITAR
jgi:hypothetical protein